MARLSFPSGNTLTPDVDRLGLCVELDRGEALLALAVTGFATAAERHVIIDTRSRQIDHHHPGANALAEIARMLERIGDDPRREAELAAVGDFQRFLVIPDLHRSGDGA